MPGQVRSQSTHVINWELQVPWPGPGKSTIETCTDLMHPLLCFRIPELARMLLCAGTSNPAVGTPKHSIAGPFLGANVSSIVPGFQFRLLLPSNQALVPGTSCWVTSRPVQTVRKPRLHVRAGLRGCGAALQLPGRPDPQQTREAGTLGRLSKQQQAQMTSMAQSLRFKVSQARCQH